MRTAEKVVAVLLDGKVKDWLSGKWNDLKAATGFGSDEFGLGRNTEKGWKPNYGPVGGSYRQKLDRRKPRRSQFPPADSEKPWDY